MSKITYLANGRAGVWGQEGCVPNHGYIYDSGYPYYVSFQRGISIFSEEIKEGFLEELEYESGNITQEYQLDLPSAVVAAFDTSLNSTH